MRILKVTQAYYPFQDRGGPATKVRSIATRLVARDHHVTVLTADLGFGPEEIASAGAERNADGWRSNHESVKAFYLKTRFRYRSLTTNPGVRDFSRRYLQEFDLVHIYGIYDLLGPAIASYCRRENIPYVVEPMGMFRPIVRNIWLKRFYHHLLGLEMFSGARKIVATSLQEQQELIQGGLPREKVVIRRNGVSVPEQLPEPGTFRRKWGIANDAKVVLFLGRIVSKKAPDLLLKAFAAYYDQNESANGSVLVLAGPDGDSSYRKRLDSLIVRLGLSKRVLFPGPLYDDSKWGAFRDSDVFVLPSQNENFGNTVAEAVACGTPVIVTDRCGVAPAIDGRAGIVVPYDQLALQKALTELLNDSDLRERLRAGCPEVASQLSWQEPLEMMEDLYRNMVREDQPLMTPVPSLAKD